MPYITGTIAAIEAITASGSSDNTGVFEGTAQKLSGGEGRRAERDMASEAVGAQRNAIKAAKDKALADQQNEEQRRAGNAVRRQARQAAVGSILTTPTLGQPSAPVYAGKTLLGS